MENIVQATARDILAEAMLRLNAAGYRIVMHVHDEAVIEAPPDTSLENICSVMGQTPAWASGLLLRADGYVCDFIRKTEVTQMGVNKFNCEGYYDPTAYEALTKIEQEAKALRAFRPVVYICSPLAGDMLKNQENARTYCRFAVEAGCVPIAPHIYFTQFMNDNDRRERDLALFMDIVLLSKCAELWVFGEKITSGMSIEIEKAKRKGQLIRYFTETCEEVRR